MAVHSIRYVQLFFGFARFYSQALLRENFHALESLYDALLSRCTLFFGRKGQKIYFTILLFLNFVVWFNLFLF